MKQLPLPVALQLGIRGKRRTERHGFAKDKTIKGVLNDQCKYKKSKPTEWMVTG